MSAGSDRLRKEPRTNGVLEIALDDDVDSCLVAEVADTVQIGGVQRPQLPRPHQDSLFRNLEDDLIIGNDGHMESQPRVRTRAGEVSMRMEGGAGQQVVEDAKPAGLGSD